MALPISRALVTGASSGIGASIARILAGTGADVVLVARSGDKLTQLAADLEAAHGIAAEVLVADLITDEGIELVADRLAADPPIDVLVNNAGFGTYGEFITTDAAREGDQVRLNVTALTVLSHQAARIFRDRGEGGILQISSMASFQPIPEHATYGASKAYVTSFGQALHEELKDTGVHVTVCCPGYTRTEFHVANDIDSSSIPDRVWLTADRVAADAIEALRHNKAMVIPGVANQALSTLSRALPDGITRKMARMASSQVNQG